MRAVRGGKRIDLPDLDALETALAGKCWAWIDVTEPSDATLAALTKALRLHPLVAVNVGERNQRAKVEQIGGVSHIVMFALAFEGEARATEIDFVLAPNFLLSIHDADWDPHLAPQLRQDNMEHLIRGPDFLLYALCDWIVDGYFPVLDRLADEIDQLQDDVVERASQWTLQRLFALKRELIALRRATSPAREIFNQLTNRDTALISPDHIVYFRDVYDHLIRVTDELDNYRELVSGTLDVYLSTVNNNLSLVMKRLTGVTVILAGIGAIAGIFGMSEAGTAFKGAEAGGFWLVALGTVVLAVVAAAVLRRIDWI
ncbi:MAG TPA: magnesium transporter CorA family protein [Candidatus Limnocylindrales bacterium]|jgi:magnesium transporter